MALAIPDLLEAYPQYSKAMLGTAMTGLSIAYGVSKFLMGSCPTAATRSTSYRWLLLSSALMAAFGLFEALYLDRRDHRGDGVNSWVKA
jgi:OPA family glycerol-3-phosphate transporter-like MFS transporter